MKKKLKGYEKYPIWIVVLFNLIFFSVWIVGAYLMYLISPILSGAFILYMLWLEANVYKYCKNCYYFGKRCAFGRGLLAKKLMKKGDPKKFTEKEMCAKDFIPSLIPTLAIILVGIYLLIQNFSWTVLILTVWPVLIFFSNQYTYGEIACPNCKQCSLGCPAANFFMKMEKAKKKK